MNIAHINLQALGRNYQAMQEKVGVDCQLMAVVKSDGYGHGAVEVAGALQGVGATCFGVGTVAEGKALRQNGVTGRIVVLFGGCDGNVAELNQYELEPVVSSPAQLLDLQKNGQPGLPVHLKVDCGMGRLGFKSDEIVQVCRDIEESPFVIGSVMSHFPMADTDSEISKEQADFFAEIVRDIHALGLNPLTHMANSAAILSDISCHEMVRTGLALYGCFPSERPEIKQVILEPVMSVTSTVLQVKQVPAGTGVSYGLTQCVERESLLAVVGVGYADGYPRSLSGRGVMLVGGARAPIIGRVCMNMVVVDVTDIPSVEYGDEVVVLGKQGENEITATEIAGWATTISYEILCTLGNLNSRVYV